MVKRRKLFIINFKTYKQATGSKALKLAKICEKFNNKTITMIAVQATDISLVSKLKIPVLAQHTDCFEQGRNTGKVLPEAIKQAGAIGAIINHSENPLKIEEIKRTIERCKKLRLLTLVCTPSIAMTKKVMKMKPWAIAYEIPKLVATGKAITKIKPERVKQFSKLFKNSRIIPLCGAGISSREDTKTAIKLGCEGVLIASAIVKAKNQEKALKEILKPFF